MSTHEYITRSGYIARRSYNGIRLGKPGRMSAWDTAELQMMGDDSVFWQARAKKAEAGFMAEICVPDDVANAFTDIFNTLAQRLTWKQIFYIWRVATWSARLGARTLVELVRETGLGA